MKNISMVLAAMLMLGVLVAKADAASKSPKLAKCNGKQRRPANPYGSILPTVDPLTGTSVPANDSRGVDVFPQSPSASPKPAKPGDKPVEQVPPISSATPPTAHRSC